MHNKKSLTEKVLELKEKYLQPANIMPKIKQTIVTITTLATLLNYIMPVVASDPLNVKEYIQQNNYNLSSIFQLYLKSLNEDGLDENEKKAIDIIANAPEEKQEEVKTLAKAIYNNGQLTPEISEELENLNLPSEKQEPVKALEDKVTQEPENPVDIYAVIANGTDDEGFLGVHITSALEFYQLMKNSGVSDDNITLFLYHPNHEDIINTGAKKWLDYHFGSTPLPHSKSEVNIDEEEVTKRKLLKEISNIPSDDNDIIYMFYASRTQEKGEFKFPGGYLNNQELKRKIKKINYGKIFVILDACYAGAFLEPLDGLKNYVGIGSCPKEETCISGILPFMLAKYKDKSVDELVEIANTEIENSKRNKATIITFYSDKKLLDEPLIPNNYLTQ